MKLYNNIKNKISVFNKNNEVLTNYLNSLVSKNLDIPKDYRLPEENLLDIVYKAKKLTKLDFRYEKKLDQFDDLKNIITLKDDSFENKYDITFLPKKLIKDNIYFISDDTNIKIQLIGDLICLGHFSNNQVNLGFVLSKNDRIEKVSFNMNHPSRELIYKNQEVFIKLFNSYGISNLDVSGISDGAQVLFDMDLNLDKCTYYKAIQKVILNFNHQNTIKNKNILL